MQVENASEDIASFLTRLKLPAAYLISFEENGYHTVNDCAGLDETRLKEMGITLPGHFRRILNKLPRLPEQSKQSKNPEMETLSPLPLDDSEGGRISPGLQYLALKTETTAKASLEHRPLTRNFSLPSPQLERDPYLTVGAFYGSENINTLAKSSTPRPLTPPPLEFSSRFEEEDIYENEANYLPPPPVEPTDVPDFEDFEEMPPPPESPLFLQKEEDPFLVGMALTGLDEENPYQTTAIPSIGNPADEYNLLHGDFKMSKPICNLTVQTTCEDDEYGHLKGDEKTGSTIPQSPNSIGAAVAIMLDHFPPTENEERLTSNPFESEYDRLNCDLPLSAPLGTKISTSLMTPPHSLPSSRKSSVGTEEVAVTERNPLSRSHSGETAETPPRPLKAIIDEKPSYKSLAKGSPEMGHLLSNMQDLKLSEVTDETDYWARDMEGVENSSSEPSYDVLSLSRRGYRNCDSKDMIERTQTIKIEDKIESLEYETVDFKNRESMNTQLESLGELPPVPHNTPSHGLDDPDDVYANEIPGSYEEVEFPIKDTRNNTNSIATAIYSGLEGIDREKSITLDTQGQKNEKMHGGRRSTGVHAHVQRAVQTAKAAVIKRKAKRKNKLEDTRSASFSDNESEAILSSQNISINKSLEDLTKVPDLPPYHPNQHQRQLSDYPHGRSPSPGSATNYRGSMLTRISPLSRRKRVDGQSISAAQDSSQTRGSIDAGIYEELDAMQNGNSVNSVTPPMLHGQTKPMKRPIKAPRMRPVSVFTDAPRNSQDGSLPGGDDRSRTYSATLKRGIPSSPTNRFLDEPDDYMDVQEFLKSNQTRQIMPVSPLTKKRTKSGWLWKQGGHEGRAPLRKRWAVFDGDELAYYENETKTEFSKGILPADVMMRLQVPPNSPTLFHLQMKGGRTFIFQAESSDDRTMWTSTIMAAMLTFQKGIHQLKPGGNMFMPYKEGALKMEGIRQKIYMAIKGDQAVYYKSKNEFMFAQPIARLQMKLATVKDLGNRKFQVIFPYRSFTFTAESEEEKKSWIDPLQEAIAEGLSDYRVLNEIWANESNKRCADCGRALPDWASINLAIIICKHCAGVHRELGVHNSKVRSLKMDIKIWDGKVKMLLIDIGNEEANKFWASNLNSSDGISDIADKNQRAWFIKSKYIDMDYVSDRMEGVGQNQLNQRLIDAVRTDNLLEAYHLTFSGADINCNTGKEHAKTPQLLAEYLTYTALAEFLRQNGGTDITSPEGHITERNTSVRKKNSIPKTRTRPPVCLKDCLFKYGGDFKNTSEDTRNKGRLNLIRSALQPGDFQKRLCVLENNTLKYCDPEKPSVVKDSLACSDLISITVHTPEQAIKAGYQHCFELSRTSGRTYLFCADKEDTRIRWTRGLMQEIVPAYIQDAMQTEEEYERIGRVKIKAKLWSKSDTQWATTWCRLCKKKLQYYHQESITMETIDLRKLVQITVDQTRETTTNQSNGLQNKDAIPIIMLVFRDKSYYIHSDTRPDTDSWMAAIRRADNVSGPMLEEKQLTTDGVPIVLEKCITYVEQFGIVTRGIYRLSGTHSKTTQLLSDFRQNARETQMREGHMNVHDVANALKRWFKSLPGSLLTEQLHEQWIETAQIKQEHHKRKLEWYKHLLEKLPDINRVTLKVLLNHLKNVSSHEKENEMSMHNLAIVFGPTLMEPQDEEGKSDKYLGQTSQEIGCIEDLLQYYDWLFDVTDTDREKEQRMQLAKEKIHQAKQQQNILTTMDYDMMVPIYIHKREESCVNYKVNMSAGELITKLCKTHGYPPDKWALYEVILDGDAERPLHFSEHVLSIIKSWETPSTNYLLAKNDYIRDKMRWLKQSVPRDIETIMEGQLRFHEGKKKWSKVTGCVTRNLQDDTVYFKYFKNTSESSDLREFSDAQRRKRSIRTRGAKMIGWSKFGNVIDTTAKPAITLNVTSFNIYLGVEKKSKPPGKQAFTIHQIGEAPKFFVAESEREMYRWISHILLSMHPEGYTPPVTQESSPTKSLDEEGSRRQSDARFNPYGTISQQELGAQIAARVVNLQRTSSNESTGSTRERFLDHSQHSGPYTPSPQGASTPSLNILEDQALEESDMSLEDIYDMHRPRIASTGSGDYSTRPHQLSIDNASRRTMLRHPLSPVDPRNQQRAGLGIQLHDELSNVLRRKNPQ